MKYLFVIFLICFTISKADKKKEIDSVYISDLNSRALEQIGKDNHKAKILLDSAFNYAYGHTSHYWVAKTYQNFGIYEIIVENYLKALDYLEVSSLAFGDVKMFDEQAYSSIILADLCYSITRYRKAIDILKRVEKNIEKVNDIYSNNVNLKLAELYQAIKMNDSAEFYRTKVILDKKIFDFKVNVSDYQAEEISTKSQIKELKREVKVEKMKTEFIIWALLAVIIFLVLISVILSTKLYKAKKEIYHLTENK